MTDERGKIPPHSPEAEEGLLGACLIDPGQDIISACMEAGLRPESFFVPTNKVILQVMMDL
jgi:replicative DNA helicase